MKLTREQRDEIRAGGAPRLTFPGDKPCPVEPEDVIPVASNLELVVQRIRKTKKDDHSVVYMIRDFRVRLPRRVPPVEAQSRAHLDSFGMPPAPTPDEIEIARIEGGSTSSKHLAVRGHELAENVHDDYQNVLDMQAKTRFSEHRKEEQAEQVARDHARQLNAHVRDVVVRCARVGVDPVLAVARLERELKGIEEDLKRAA